MRKSLGVLLSVFIFGVSNIQAEHWPQWRGPSLNGISAEKNLPVRWSTTENVTWKLAMPERSGASSAATAIASRFAQTVRCAGNVRSATGTAG